LPEIRRLWKSWIALVVSRIFASWNQIDEWLKRLDEIRHAA